ncbi:putative NBD/HSP70 family sugar kinase [Actinoplanes tereljensis]|uniref:Sugar kinase n=1 Tax=Paractinoplanes tereljensis TaxID=571912 RepID=A0A919NL84_9ACTN|nr:ROK family transcriptional regulator [Actinoplanes tereljensis]GIF20844.1 sugar kinase [Actinoplanes tereljensis]
MTRPVHRVAPATDTPVRQESLRAHNLSLTFRQIVGAPAPISRIELAVATGLTRPTITRIVDELLAGGLIVEAAPSRSGNSGRPRVGLSLAPTGPAGLGLDIRVDALSACVVDLTGTVRHLAFAARPPAAADALARLAEMGRAAMAAAAAEDLTVVGTTLAAPGPVENASVVRFAPVLGWRDVDAGAALRPALGEVTVDHDAGLAALGELYASAPALRNFVCVSGEFDIGAGIVLEGSLLRGARGWSGSLGHVAVTADGPECACGATGCLQHYAGLQQILGASPASAAPAGGPATASVPVLAPAVAIDTLVSSGDTATLAALERAGTALGVALSALVNIIDVDTVLLGGSYSLLASWLIEGVERELNRRVLTASWAPVSVRPAPLGPDAAVIGAALSAIDRVRQDPNSWLARA